METVKRPEVMLSAIAAAAAAGSAAYSYRRLNDISGKMTEVTTQLRNAVNRLDNHESHRGMISELEKVIESMEDLTARHSRALEGLNRSIKEQ